MTPPNKHLDARSKMPVNRRRCLAILASSAALPIVAGMPDFAKAGSPLKKIKWTGRALGADAGIILYTDDEAHARATLQNMRAEITRLEQYFSLFKKNSLIGKLNETGTLKNPPPEFFELVRNALDISQITGGRFDPTVQPLFMAFKACSRDRRAHVYGRPYEIDERIVEARSLINHQNVICTRDRISFARPGMGLTLNGIAQGYITDRARDILKAAGFAQTLVNFGEYHAGAPKPGAAGWRIQLGQGPGSSAEESVAPPVWTLKDSALAASEKSGYVFDADLDLHHMLDPRSGTSARHWREIYVEAPSATLADAASTALFATPPKDVQRVFEALELTRAYLIKSNGDVVNLGGDKRGSKL